MTCTLMLRILSCLVMAEICLLSAEESKPFRVSKHNMIWNKVQNKMSTMKLEKLRRNLQEQDDKHLKWKELKLHGGDADGKMEAKLRKNLLSILETLGLSRYADPADIQREGMDDNVVGGRSTFGDERLEQLWQMINKQGKFSKDELKELKTEFEHHKHKIYEYQRLLKLLHKQHDISDNSVFIHDRMNDNEIEKLKRKLKDKHAEMNDDYTELEEKITGQRTDKEFRDYRVTELWERAQQRGFTENELQSIKEELKHFDHKISKHEHFKKQVEKSEFMLQRGEDLSHDHEELKKKEKEHGRYVKKLHSTLLDRVSHRTEL